MSELINNITTALIYGIYLVLPGYIVLSCTGTHRHKFLLSIGISISIVVLTLVPIYWIKGGISLWLGILHLVIAAVIAGVRLFPTLYPNQKIGKVLLSPLVPKRFYGLGFIFLLVSFGVYHVIVGPYTEIPSDFWKHLSRVGVESSLMVDGILGHSSTSKLGSSPIYVIHAIVASLLGINPLELVAPVTLVTSCLFLGSIYWFTLGLLDRFGLGVSSRVAGALLAAALTFMTLGTASFSYVRYYAYFPTIFAFPRIYATIAISLDFLERPRINGWQLLLIPVFLVTMWLIHRQEVLLTLILMGGIVFVRGIRSYVPAVGMSTTLKRRARSSLQLCLALLAFVTIYAFTTRAMGPWGHTPHVVDTGLIFPALTGLPIDNPFFRFWDTLGYFGLGVYAWFLLRWKTLVRSDFLSAGMLMPLLTNFNPLYAVLFLHFGTETSLWRTAYLMPLGIAAAILFTVTFLSKSARQTTGQQITAFFIMSSLIMSLIPWHYQDRFNRTSRIPSLLPVHETSGAGLWHDLIKAVDQIQAKREVRRIITDDVTRFVLYSATRGQVWWWTEREYFPNHREDYQEDFLTSDFTHSLLVINKRNGVLTNSAQYAGHWSPDILKVSRNYPHDLDEFIATYPDYFELLWSAADVKIYLMHPFKG